MGRAACAASQLLAGLVRPIQPGACCVRLIEPGALPWLVARLVLPVLLCAKLPGTCPSASRCA